MRIMVLRLLGRLWLVVGSSVGLMLIGPVTVLDGAGASYLALALLAGFPAACLLTSPRRKPHGAPVGVRGKANHLWHAKLAPAQPQGSGNSGGRRHLAAVDKPLVPAA